MVVSVATGTETVSMGTEAIAVGTEVLRTQGRDAVPFQLGESVVRRQLLVPHLRGVTTLLQCKKERKKKPQIQNYSVKKWRRREEDGKQ